MNNPRRTTKIEKDEKVSLHKTKEEDKMRMKISSVIITTLTLAFLACLIFSGFSGLQAQDVDKNKILREQFRIRKQLHPTTQSRIAQAVQEFEQNILAEGEEANPVFVASRAARNQFREVSPLQTEVLGFYVLCQATSSLEEDISLITAEIEKMNRVKDELNRLINDMDTQIKEKTESGAQETSRAAEEKETPVLREQEALETAPHYKTEYPKSPELIYSKELESMSIAELNNDLYYVKTALNSVHKTSEKAVEALRKEMDRRTRFLSELLVQSEDISRVEDDEIKIIR